MGKVLGGRWALGPSAYHALDSHHLIIEALQSSRKRRYTQYKAPLMEHLKARLSYVNANLVLSRVMDAALYDWADYMPFYRTKFLGVGMKEKLEHREMAKISELFRIAFPEFTHADPKMVIRILRDKRLSDLRDFIRRSAEANTQFDTEFANKVLREIFIRDYHVKRFRNFVSWLSLPVGFIPWLGTPLQKAIEESTVYLKEQKELKDFRWFFLISELVRDLNQPCQQVDTDDA